VAGTSTGGLLALGLTKPDPLGKLIGARYFRFQEEGVTAEMDDARDSTLDGLVRVAEAIIAREEKRLDELARVLVSGAAAPVS
jgi:hypothetical protein